MCLGLASTRWLQKLQVAFEVMSTNQELFCCENVSLFECKTDLAIIGLFAMVVPSEPRVHIGFATTASERTCSSGTLSDTKEWI